MTKRKRCGKAVLPHRPLIALNTSKRQIHLQHTSQMVLIAHKFLLQMIILPLRFYDDDCTIAMIRIYIVVLLIYA